MASVVAESSPPERSTTAGCPANDGLSAAGDVTPDHLVQLHLETHRKPVLEDPVGKPGRGELLKARREKHLAACVQALVEHALPAPVVVRAVADHELELVAGAQAMHRQVEVTPVLARARRLDVDDAGDARVHAR